MALTGFAVSGRTHILQRASNTTAHTIKNPGQTVLMTTSRRKQGCWGLGSNQPALCTTATQELSCGNTESCRVTTKGDGGELSLQPTLGSEELGTAQTHPGDTHCTSGCSRGHQHTVEGPPAARALMQRDRAVPQNLCPSLPRPSGQAGSCRTRARSDPGCAQAHPCPTP